jgi:hypothetical protein
VCCCAAVLPGPAADGVVELTLTKAEGMHWWSSVLAGGPAIDVQAVEPENSKLTDLDPETRQTVEKMMVRGGGSASTAVHASWWRAPQAVHASCFTPPASREQLGCVVCCVLPGRPQGDILRRCLQASTVLHAYVKHRIYSEPIYKQAAHLQCIAGPAGTRRDLMVLRMGCSCQRAVQHVKHHRVTHL